MLFRATTILLLSTAAFAGIHEFQAKTSQFRQKRSEFGEFVGHSRASTPRVERRDAYLNHKTQPFWVNGTALPEVDFDIGESYAGNLANTPSGNSSLFFWFFPSDNPDASDEIAVWLTGGPGCSSLAGLILENGPFLWQSGTYSPIRNPYSWVNLTNMVWIDQPAGTGMSPGPWTANNEIDVANQFNDFWVRFMDTFDLHGRKIYIIGESYAGEYIPYIASSMLDKNDKTYYDVSGVMLVDGLINEWDTMIEAPSGMALNYYNNVINLNETFLKDINERYQTCGYYDFMEKALTFPPTGKLPNAPSSTQPGCTMWEDIVTAALYTNPCFNYYHLTDFCPFPWSIMGLYPSGGPNNYWNRSDVQAVIHAPPTNYLFCGEWPPFPNGQPSPETPFGDTSLPSSLGPLPSVIERTNNVVINNGMLDFVIFANGTLVSIQNMTWNGAQGFQKAPSNSLFVPYHPGLAENAAAQLASAGSWTTQVFIQDAGSGYLGLTHTERGLTFNTVLGSGHQIPMYAPGAAYRVFEFLLGRIGNLTDQGDFTTLPGNFTG